MSRLESTQIYGDLHVVGEILNKATLNKQGVVKLNSAVNSTLETEAATPKAVKTAYDLASGKEAAFSKNTAFNKNFETSTANIKMNGSVAVGTSTNIARADHVHPVDTSRAAASHAHGNIANGGTIGSAAVAPANTDYILISDASNSGKIEKSIAIGTATTTFLRNDGTWATPPDTKYTHPNATRNNTTSTAAPAHGATFTAIDSLTSDASGHVTAVNTKTVTIPAAPISLPANGGNADTVDGKHATDFATAGHTHSYLPLAGGTLTSFLTLHSNPTANLHAATKQYVDTTVNNLLGANDAMIFKGVLSCSSNPNYPAGSCGWTYKVSAAGKIGGASGVNVEIGDMLICTKDGSAAGDHATVGANWTIVQNNIDGAVTGPASSTVNNVAVFNATTGKIIKDSGFTIGKSVPSNAVFTDTNTWRGIQDNLTSTSTTESLSANQGKVLKGLVDGKANASHGNHVPTTQTANNAIFLRNDNTWQTITPANIGAAAASHGTHVTYATAAPLVAGTASAGSTNDVARGNHVHPLQTSVSGNAGTASKWATARTITLGNMLTGSVSLDGSANVTLNASIARIDLTGVTVDLNTYNLSSGSPVSIHYKEKSTGGATNITNAPIKEPFLLDVYVIRWASASDYITKQVFTSATTKAVYERWCTNGTWTGWTYQVRTTAAVTSGQVMVADGTTGGVKTTGYTIATSVPSGAKFTDTLYTASTGLTLTGTAFKVNFETSAGNFRVNGVAGAGSLNTAARADHTHPVWDLIRGSYLTGSNYNGSTGTTWSVDATTTATASKVVARDGNADVLARLFRSNYANQTTISGAIAYRVSNSGDDYIRFCSDNAAIRTFTDALQKMHIGASAPTGTRDDGSVWIQTV